MLNILGYIAIGLVVAAAGYAVGKWLFKKDTEIENRRRAAGRLAGVLRGYGLKRTPEFLEDYNVGDYSGMGNKMAELVKLFLEGEAAVIAEFENVFDACLKARLESETGRAYIAAKLTDAFRESDPSVVRDAPEAFVEEVS